MYLVHQCDAAISGKCAYIIILRNSNIYTNDSLKREHVINFVFPNLFVA